jgi:DNA-binding transcriptional ArsR family regulator
MARLHALLDIHFDICENVSMSLETKTPATSEASASSTASNEAMDALLGFFRALADPSRLKIVGLLAERSCPVEQLSAMVGLGESTVSHHLSKLAEAGLVSARADGHYAVYSLETEALADMARRLLKTERLPELAQGIDRDVFDRKVLASFVGPDGRFVGFPSQEKKYLVLLRHVLRDFQPGVRYPEKKVNEILGRYSDDTARLRRSLVDFGLMNREGGGRDYWMKEPAAS